MRRPPANWSFVLSFSLPRRMQRQRALSPSLAGADQGRCGYNEFDHRVDRRAPTARNRAGESRSWCAYARAGPTASFGRNSRPATARGHLQDPARRPGLLRLFLATLGPSEPWSALVLPILFSRVVAPLTFAISRGLFRPRILGRFRRPVKSCCSSTHTLICSAPP